jgi:transketolase
MEAENLELQSISRPVTAVPEKTQRLISAYTNSLLEQARKNHKIVALDADLILDTGLIPFKNEFPDRFVECGIAEQDMVSQAGGMALKGLLPVVHSFACFLSARPNEQIYNNATERKKIIYVGSLAGVVPGGPGHSHQAVRDIAALGAIPGLALIEPSCEAEVGMLLDWALNKHLFSSYLRIISIPTEIDFSLPEGYCPEFGRGVEIKAGEGATIITYGPVMLANACKASAILYERYSVRVSVNNLPWLNFVDSNWIDEISDKIKIIVSIDNHYEHGAQGDRIATAISNSNKNNVKYFNISIKEIPACGTNKEILQYHSLDPESIADYMAIKMGIK